MTSVRHKQNDWRRKKEERKKITITLNFFLLKMLVVSCRVCKCGHHWKCFTAQIIHFQFIWIESSHPWKYFLKERSVVFTGQTCAFYTCWLMECDNVTSWSDHMTWSSVRKSKCSNHNHCHHISDLTLKCLFRHRDHWFINIGPRCEETDTFQFFLNFIWFYEMFKNVTDSFTTFDILLSVFYSHELLC